MSLGADTVVVNGERVNIAPYAAYVPQGYGPQTVGVPNVTPSYPAYLGGTTGTQPGAEGVGGYGTAGNNSMVAGIANAHPFNLRVSPVMWAIVGLAGGLILLKAIHWRETILEGNEGLDLGPAHESADAGVK